MNHEPRRRWAFFYDILMSNGMRADALVEHYDREILEEKRLDVMQKKMQASVGEVFEIVEPTSAACGLSALRAEVEKQAEDPGLWAPAETATEAYLQQELRRLHVMIEEDK